MDAGWRVTVDFNSQCKILWGEKRTPIHEKTELKNKNLHN